MSPQGKQRARTVASLRATSRRRITSKGSGRIDGRPFLAIVAFIAIYLAVSLVWRVATWVAGFYAVMSIVCALVYLIDKSAAKHRRQRISEGMLLGLGLFGGWPGAIVAQQVLRHKTSKASFRRSFWFSVIANVLVFVGSTSQWSSLTRIFGRTP